MVSQKVNQSIKGLRLGINSSALMAKSMSTSVSDISSKNSAKRKKIVIEHVDLDELNLIVDGEKLTEARAAAMGEELAKEAHRILKMGNPKYVELD